MVHVCWCVAQEVGEFSRVAVFDDVREDAGDLSCLSLR